MHTDPIADLLTRLRNAVKARHLKLTVPHSRVKTLVLDAVKRRKFITDFKVVKNGQFQEIEIELNPEYRELNLKRVSKPGQRIYIGHAEIKPVRNGYGMAIVSTPKGVMSGEEAAKAGVGGEYLCEIW